MGLYGTSIKGFGSELCVSFRGEVPGKGLAILIICPLAGRRTGQQAYEIKAKPADGPRLSNARCVWLGPLKSRSNACVLSTKRLPFYPHNHPESG